ncbi:MAG: anaerobic glycerol-3-phosphate dehydrogenase subunit C [Mobiluncus porci]|uniref:anaerobic glycerol-3-phosphate dehydrogenase subunit C n=1 Tax=Mobiluncus porci TaxID=2652278 RepID=UPI0023F537B9|nr:anaerobic glycerol-3-phosphate dehydrogenase subunit C [Mobiluncus porci]MDD7540954.1 anaerobic glycerol-3-phosphate dehydrogenase subunit C [Mobiluncus porci]MDY5747922.1 anaerobic glycerol-3-phosphate dehydrogenase subunit C [Mobiluncus porci]
MSSTKATLPTRESQETTTRDRSALRAKPPKPGDSTLARKKSPLDFARDSLARFSLDECVKCTICEQNCPVLRVTEKFSGPKFVGPQAERFRHGQSVDHSLDYCSGCSICTTVCPQGVKIAEINAQARAVMKAQPGKMPLRDRLITQTELEGKLLTPMAPLANAAMGIKPVRKLAEAVVGVHAEAPTPKAQKRSFMSWWKHHEKELASGKSPYRAKGAPKRGPVVFFHGCAGGYFEVATSIATVEVLEYLGFDVVVPKQGCCGLASQSNGLFDEATKMVLRLSTELRRAGRDLTIVSSSGSCAGMLRHEAHEIMGVESAALRDVGSRMVETSEFLAELLDEGDFPIEDLRPMNLEILYHQPCQVKSQGIGKPAIRVMEAIPGVKVVESGEACCGIGGTYGLKKEKFAVAQAIGKPLFEKVKAVNPTLAACETETCRWQIRKGTGAEVIHPVELVCQALGLPKDGRA